MTAEALSAPDWLKTILNFACLFHDWVLPSLTPIFLAAQGPLTVPVSKAHSGALKTLAAVSLAIHRRSSSDKMGFPDSSCPVSRDQAFA